MWHAFAESKFFRESEPIGNELDTGGPPRLREEDWGFSAGLRKKTPLGGSWEVSHSDRHARQQLPLLHAGTARQLVPGVEFRSTVAQWLRHEPTTHR